MESKLLQIVKEARLDQKTKHGGDFLTMRLMYILTHFSRFVTAKYQNVRNAVQNHGINMGSTFSCQALYHSFSHCDTHVA